MKCPLSSGVRGWVATAAVILAVDLLGEITLSESFRNFSRTRNGRIVATAGWALLTAHLFGVIPVEHDPIVLAFARVPKRKKVGIVVV